MKQKLLKLMCLLCVSVISASAWAETSTVTASKVASASASWTGSASETWAVSVNGGATNQNVTNSYAQVGTKNSPSTSITFSTSGISGTITSIVVDCASYEGKATISATVGGAAFGTQSQSIPSWSSNSGGEVTFTGNASGEIVITMTNGSGGRAMYIKSIVVTYTPSSAVENNRQYITLWSEDFSSYSSGNVPNGGEFSYSVSNGTGSGTTKIYDQNTAGGTSPELLVAKTNGSFTATITDFKSCTGEFLLNFVTNKGLTVIITADGDTIETTGNVKSDRTKTTLSFTLPQGTKVLVIEFKMTTNDNARLDNIVLKGNTYTRTVTSGNWGTICLPYDATVAGAKLYTIVGKEITGSEVTAILLDEVASIEAGKPYIFKATADNVVATYTGTTYTAAGAVNGLYGTYSAIAAGKWDTYVSGDLYLMTTSNVQAADKTTSSLAANRAYIVLDDVNNIGSPVKGVRLGFDGTETPTGIKNLTPALSEGEGVIYNLNGQRVNSLQKGINIVGGKKVLVK